MQNTSNITNWDTNMSLAHSFRPTVRINGVYYDYTKITSMRIIRKVFPDKYPTIGNACAAEIDLELKEPDVTIPPMAAIDAFVSVYANSADSGLLNQGKFFIDTREIAGDDHSTNILKLHGYDSMLKADADWPSTSGVYPMYDTTMVQLIASQIGVSVDSITYSVMNKVYRFNLPSNYTMREVLGMIASAYGGNFVITKDNTLRLLTLYSYPIEQNLLISNNADVIIFGSDAILV